MNLSTTQPEPDRKLTRADITDRVARELIAAKQEARRARTARLRAARLERGAAEKAIQAAGQATGQPK